MKLTDLTYPAIPSVDGMTGIDLFVDGRIRVEIVQLGDLPAPDEVA
ncbi:MAG: hypothetical protein ACOCV2_14385 [Persicimonas sp.]